MTDEDNTSARLYRVPEAAKLLGLGRTSVYALLKSGALNSVHVGRSRRIRRDDLDRFIQCLPSSRP
jgi:excisionase family DNA binding protein